MVDTWPFVSHFFQNSTFRIISASVRFSWICDRQWHIKKSNCQKRPCWIKSEIPLLIPIPRDYSFPSGHTLVSFEGAFSIWKYNRKWGFAALVVASLIGCSRLYLFVHFPTDVLAGIALAMINAWAGDKIAIWIETNFQRVMKRL